MPPHPPAEPETHEIAFTSTRRAPIWLIIDGRESGTITRKAPLRVAVSEGPHEVRLTFQQPPELPPLGGPYARCAGIVDVRESMQFEVRGPQTCPIPGSDATLAVSWTAPGSWFGAVVIDGEVLQVDRRIAIAPGRHSFAATWTGGECTGTVTLTGAENARIFVSPDGCDGLDPGASVRIDVEDLARFPDDLPHHGFY